MRNLILASIFFSQLFLGSAVAGEIKRIVETIDMNENQALEINFPVGSLNIEVTDSKQLKLEIEIEPKDSSWFSDSTDLSHVNLDKVIKDSKIELEIDHENIKQTWTVKVPKTAELDLDLGVGSIKVEDLANSAEVNMGVGSVRISLDSQDYSDIELESGVGDTRLKGFEKGKTSTRAMVSSTTSYHGSGKYDLAVNVGVGDIRVK